MHTEDIESKKAMPDQIQMILKHCCSPEMQERLKSSKVYKDNVDPTAKAPSPLEVWTYLENLGVQTEEEKMSQADSDMYDHHVELLKTGMYMNKGDSIENFENKFKQQVSVCYQRKKSTKFSPEDLGKWFWKAIRKDGSKYTKAAKDLAQYVHISNGTAKLPATMTEVKEWCQREDQKAEMDALLSRTGKISGASNLTGSSIFATEEDAGAEKKRASRAERKKRRSEPKGSAVASEAAPGGEAGAGDLL